MDKSISNLDMFKTVSCKEISGSGAASIRVKKQLSDAGFTFITDFNSWHFVLQAGIISLTLKAQLLIV
jgi:hypothetical protein